MLTNGLMAQGWIFGNPNRNHQKNEKRAAFLHFCGDSLLFVLKNAAKRARLSFAGKSYLCFFCPFCGILASAGKEKSVLFVESVMF